MSTFVAGDDGPVKQTPVKLRIGQETESLPDDDEIGIELAPISVQLAYVQHILGCTQNSLESYINVTLNLSPKQNKAFYLNRMLLLLHSNKLDQARELFAVMRGMFPNSVMPVLVQAAMHVKENKHGKAEQILRRYAVKYPEKSKVVLLGRAQIAAAAGHYLVSAESLAKIADTVHHMTATVGNIVQWWSNSMTQDDKVEIIMREVAAFKLKHGKKDEAWHLYEQLVKSYGSIEALVSLIQTAAETDIDKAEAYEKQLKPLHGLKSVDIAALEKTCGAKPVERTSHIPETYEAKKSKDKTKKKRKRKPKYPKGFDPANPGPPPDPERWLPKRERSSYRPKRKDKRVATTAAARTNSKSNESANSKGALHIASTEHSKPSKSSKNKSRR